MSVAVEAPPPGISRSTRKGTLYFLKGEFTLTFDPNFRIEYKYEYEMHVDLVKRLKQKIFDTRRNTWTIPTAEDAIKTLNQLIGYGILATKDAREEISKELKKIAERSAVASIATADVEHLDIPTAPDLTKILRSYQKTGAKFMATVERAYNADEMGTGKSLQCLTAFEIAGSFPALVICPVKLKQNWLDEARKWLPHRSSSLHPNEVADITILSYTEIHKYVNVDLGSPKAKVRKAAALDKKRYFFPSINKVVAVACDEGHFIKENSSRRTMAARAIAEACGARYRYVLSGTPVENRPAELIAPIEFLGLMEKMGGWHSFVSRYCGMKQTKFGLDLKGATNTKELNARISQLFYIRRKKADILKDLPDKIECVQEVEMSSMDEYRRIERDVKAYMVEQQGRLLSEGQSSAAAMMKLNLLRQAVGKGKVDWIVDWVDTFLEGGEKFVLYAHHREVLAGLVRGLQKWNPACVLAGCPDVKKEQDRFMQDEKCRLFIGSIMAAGFGLTLTRASHIGIAELMWTHSKHQQTVDRVHRIGQKDCVNAYYFLAPGTIDDDMWQVVSAKAQIVAAAADGETLAQNLVLTNLMRKYQAVAA